MSGNAFLNAVKNAQPAEAEAPTKEEVKGSNEINQGALEALEGMLGGIRTGGDNSQTVVAARLGNTTTSYGVTDGMQKSGYYSISKGRVKGVLAASVAGRFYFPLDANGNDSLKEELEKLVLKGIYMKVAD